MIIPSQLRAVLAVLLLCVSTTTESSASHAHDALREAHWFRVKPGWVGPGMPTEEHTAQLAQTIDSKGGKTARARGQAAESFLNNHPHSGWAASVHLNLGLNYQDEGRISLALLHFRAGWSLASKETSLEGRKIGDACLINLTKLLASLGRVEELRPLFAESKDRPLRGSFHTAYYSSLEAYQKMVAQPGIAYRCGSLALRNVAERLGADKSTLLRMELWASPETGFSLLQLTEMARECAVPVLAVKRTGRASRIPIPAVVHWEENHYAAVLDERDGMYLIADPTFRSSKWITAEVLDAEASGYFLIRAEQGSAQFREVSGEEARTVFGRGFPNTYPPMDYPPFCPTKSDSSTDDKDCTTCMTPPDEKDRPGSAGGTAGPGWEQGPGRNGKIGSSTSSKAMPIYQVSEPFINLWFEDTPLFYTPGIGPEVAITVHYQQRPTGEGDYEYQSDFFGFGDRWSTPLLSYLQETVYTTNGAYKHFTPGGPILLYNVNSEAGGQFTGLTMDHKVLTYAVDGSGAVTKFILTAQDGSQEEFSYKVFGTTRRWFLTKMLDPTGHGISLQYSETPNTSGIVRLRHLIDAAGQTNSVGYIGTTDNLLGTNLITSVTNAFGDVCRFQYETNGWLTNITDVAGISSSFKYDTNIPSFGWITALVTPYGTNTFVHTDNGIADGSTNMINRSLLISNPLGGKELYLYRDDSRAQMNYLVPDVSYGLRYPTDQVPTVPGVSVDNAHLAYRNSFYYNPRQYANLSSTNAANWTTNDYRKGRLRHWLHLTVGLESGEVSNVLGMERDASPDHTGLTEGLKTWYNYPRTGGGNEWIVGDNMLPWVISYITPQDETFYRMFGRNAFGNITNVTETYHTSEGTASTRSRLFVYATNNIDLIESWNFAGELMLSNRFNAHHQPTNQYNGMYWQSNWFDSSRKLVGQLLPTGLLITNSYYTSGASNGFLRFSKEYRLASGSPEWFRTNGYTYVKMLVHSHTNTLGLVVTNSWDALRRHVKTTYPDGSFEEIAYGNASRPLDPSGRRDRLGNWNYFGYNQLRRLVALTNALGHATTYDICSCGAIHSVTDAMTNTTTYGYDNQGRVLTALLPGGSSITNIYDLVGRITGFSDGGIITSNFYNLQGKLTNQTRGGIRTGAWTHDVEDRIVSFIDINGVSVTNTLDKLGRLITRFYPDGGIEMLQLNARGLVSYTNQLGTVRRYEYDERGLRVAETNEHSLTVAFKYDSAGNLTNLINNNGHNTFWRYDREGRLTNTTDNSSSDTFRYTYGTNGLLASRWTPQKGTTLFSWDATGNLTNVNYSQTSDVDYVYDNAGRLVKMTDAVGTTTFGYTGYGSLLFEDGPWANDKVSYTYNSARYRSSISVEQPNGAAWTQTYLYDSVGRLTNTVSPAGRFDYTFAPVAQFKPQRLALANNAYVTNTYDSTARLRSTTLKNSSHTSLNYHAYDYNLAHQRTNHTLFYGNFWSYAYDSTGQLTNAIGREAGGTILRHHEKFAYGYDAVGNLISRTNNESVQAFSADSLSQLTNVARLGTTITASGFTTPSAVAVTVKNSSTTVGTVTPYADSMWAATNFVAISSGQSSFPYAVAEDSWANKVTNNYASWLRTNFALLYDLNGNLTNQNFPTLNYTYDDENRLVQFKLSTGAPTIFTYDGFGRRRTKTELGWVTEYVYDGNVVIMERHIKSGESLFERKVRYTRGLDLAGNLQGAGGIGGLLARTEGEGPGIQSVYYHADANGNVTFLSDQSQQLAARYVYDPFGTVSSTGPLASSNVFQWSSQEHHPASGLSLYLHRAYSPSLQRWLSPDPLGEIGFEVRRQGSLNVLPEGFNAYVFVINDPINYVDPFGDVRWNQVGLGALAVIGGGAFILLTPVLLPPAAVAAGVSGAITVGLGITATMAGLTETGSKNIPTGVCALAGYMSDRASDTTMGPDDKGIGQEIGQIADGFSTGARLKFSWDNNLGFPGYIKKSMD